MASEIKIKVNRANAQKSTGPRTPEGKARVAQNAFRHGLRSRRVLLPIENPAGFEALSADFHAEWQPATLTEHDLVEQLVVNKWKIARMEAVENQACMQSSLVHLALRRSLDHRTENGGVRYPDATGRREGHAERSIARASQHISRLERAYFRALTVLQKLQALRARRVLRPVP